MYQNCVLVKVFEMNRIVLGIKLGCYFLMIEVNVFKVFVFIILCGFSFYYYV